MGIVTPVYTTREAVKAAPELKETARANAAVDDAIEAASRSVEGLLHRRFYPWTGTRYFDWPNSYSRTAGRLWLGGNELISVTTFTTGNGATTLTAGQYILRRADDLDEPPYTHVEINRGTSAAFSSGTTTQRALAITGVFGHSAETAPAGALAEALDASETGVDVTDSASIGVGQIIKVDSERMIVSEKSMITSGQTLQTPLTATAANETVAVTTGSAFFVGEVILLDSERMLIVDIAGNNLTVKRGWDGSTLATHTGSTIYAPRSLTVVRGALGTTAAAHDTAAAITKHVVPGLVRELCEAEALVQLAQRNAAYARVVGTGDNERESSGRGLAQIRKDAIAAYGRLRSGAI